MVGRTYSAALIGIDAEIIQIEVDTLPSQLPGLTIVGLPDKAVQEAKERIVSAIKNSGFEWPRRRIVVNLAPADIPKTGSAYDLPIAVAILAASSQAGFDESRFLFVGELALDGTLRDINGALSVALICKHKGIGNLLLPAQNAYEAGLVEDISVFGINSLKEAINVLTKESDITPVISSYSDILNPLTGIIDFKDIHGQNSVKRAAEIAASGGHNLLMSGTPGSGKTLISKALPGILPELTFEESLEITKIYSVANLLETKSSLIKQRPFRSPHHTASTTSIIGGGKYPKPGELSLAHRGILFLDEFPEFTSFTLEALRQPIEDKKVVISRVSGTLTFPSNFMLVAAMNPCKCGWKGDPEKECVCSPHQIEIYKKKISGPILDRIDLQINVPRVKVEDLSKFDNSNNESSADIKSRVQKSRNIQLERYKNENIFCNAEIAQKDIERFCVMAKDAKELLAKAAQKLNLSARSYFRIMRVSRTIADLGNSGEIKKEHISEAVQYRISD